MPSILSMRALTRLLCVGASASYVGALVGPKTFTMIPTNSASKVLRPAFRPLVRCFALPTNEEMEPGSPEMKARAQVAREKYADKILNPKDATLFALENQAKIIDVRTAAERARHEINGVKGRTIRGALSCPLNDMVAGTTPVPSGPLLLVCTRGPKSLVALDFILGDAGVKADVRLVDGGTTAWDSAGLPTENVA